MPQSVYTLPLDGNGTKGDYKTRIPVIIDAEDEDNQANDQGLPLSDQEEVYGEYNENE